ncbi:MAG TPA: MFS transporter, partial [Thermoplasmata archaeon]|nr:MFS transporter [Thermoplasmata archaeon]
VAVTLAGFSPNLGDALGMSRANELYLLIGIRAVQGVGMAMFPLAFALIGEEFPPSRIAQAQGIVSAMFSAGASIGLFGGAWITQRFGWQLTYHTVIPIALVVLALTALYLRESRMRFRQPVDVPGAATLALSIVCFLLGLTEGPTWGWANPSGASLFGLPFGVPEFFALSALLLVAFVLWERRTPRPIVDFAKLGERNILLPNAIGFFAGIAMFMLFVGIVARAEAPSPVGLGKTPLEFGLYSLPTTLTNMVVGPIAGRSMGRIGPKLPMGIGGGLLVVGGLFLAFNNGTVLDLIVGPIPVMTGVILIFIAMINLVVLSSRPQETGIQTGMNQTFRNLGTSIGPVLGATILASVLTSYSVLRTFPTGSVLVHFEAPGPLAFQWIFGLIALFGALALLLTIPVRNVRFLADGTRAGRPAPPEAAAPIPPARPAPD